MHKKILIYGESWQGTLPQLLLSDLKSRCVESEVFDYTTIMPGIRNRSFLQKLLRRVFYRLYVKKINAAFLGAIKIFDPAIIIVAKGLHISAPTLLNIKEQGIQLINWNPDDFFNMKNSNSNLIESMKLYDLVISSRPHLFEKYYNHGTKDILFIDWYYVPSLHYAEKIERTIKYSFVGSWSKYREDFINKIDKPFFVRGGGWEKSSPQFKIDHDVDSKILSQLEMREIFNKSEVNLNILTPDNHDISNLRFFEVPASGGLLLTERNSHSLNYLQDKEECLMYSSIEEIQSLLEKDFDSKIIASLGTKKIQLDHHSFSDRVGVVLKYINNE